MKMNEIYLFFDENKNIKVISSEIEPYKHLNKIKIDSRLALDFFSGKKLMEDYFVKQNNLNLFTVEKKHTVNYNNIYTDLIKAKKKNDQYDLQIKVNNLKNQYEFSLSDFVKESLSTSEYERTLKFYVVKSDQINWILNSITVQIKDLIKETVIFNFKTPYESSLDNIEIITRRYFENIGLVQ